MSFHLEMLRAARQLLPRKLFTWRSLCRLLTPRRPTARVSSGQSPQQASLVHLRHLPDVVRVQALWTCVLSTRPHRFCWVKNTDIILPPLSARGTNSQNMNPGRLSQKPSRRVRWPGITFQGIVQRPCWGMNITRYPLGAFFGTLGAFGTITFHNTLVRFIVSQRREVSRRSLLRSLFQ